jgi:SCP-2 sterol transfer family
MDLDIALAPGAEANGFAVMLSDLVRQNLETNPHKQRDFKALDGVVAIVADDAEVALTLAFDRGALRVYSGVVGVPDVVIHGSSDTILALSNLRLSRGLPLPPRGDEEGRKILREVVFAMRSGALRTEASGGPVFGLVRRLPLLLRLTRVMSVHG